MIEIFSFLLTFQVNTCLKALFTLFTKYNVEGLLFFPSGTKKPNFKHCKYVWVIVSLVCNMVNEIFNQNVFYKSSKGTPHRTL